MNVLDVVVLIVVAFCLIRGLFRGLIREVAGIIAVVAGFYGANTYYPMIAVHIEPWIESPGIRNLLCFFILFSLILMVVGALARLIRKLLRLVFLGWVDRTFGMVFGGAKGVLIIAVLFIMVTTFVPGNGKLISDSKTAPHVASVAKAMTLFVSRNMKADFFTHLEGMQKKWKK